MNRQFIRSFAQSSAVLKPGYSTVHPVHHLVKVEKTRLKPGYQEVLIPKDDIRSNKFKPTEVAQDRVREHYENALASDLMLNLYRHDAKVIVGNKKRSWGTDSPYKLYRQLRKPVGTTRPTKNVYPIKHTNIPKLESVVIHAYDKAALFLPHLNIRTRLQLAILSNVKPKIIYGRSNILPWKARVGRACGAKVELFDRDMSQFITTLTEMVLPRIRTFTGIPITSGDKNGNITMGLNPDDCKYFPEFEHFQELFPRLNGMHITFKTSAQTDAQAKTLLSCYGFPFAKTK
ncbi:54S ribosomal protein L7, mitochondrial [Candida viswanathii]|uniref:54S ribosomal protein L7, mitochondrial n=1 Tax=Candida viswanathii TaxID=5486 RepID=A0A367XPA2_9ASCO|nr:54S ribosomal protein L7, mitochondrial [Candida viswanathii]